jgi:hypothetical protein
MWNVYLIDTAGNCDRINDQPYSLRDVESFLDGLGIPLTAVLLTPAG